MLVFNLLLAALVVNEAFSKKVSSAKKLLQNEIKNVGDLACKRTNIKYLRRLHEEDSKEKLKSCLLKVLDSKDSNNAFLWSLLGEVFSKQREKSKANICFKESARIMGKVSKFIPQWHFIGPFTIGKSEVDGDPLDDWKGAQNASRFRWNDKVVYYSELVPNGEVKWTTVTVNRPSEAVYVAPAIEWNELVMSLQSMGIAEWQGWVFGDVIVNEDCTIIFQGLGVHTLYIGDVMIVGDLYKRDVFWHPVHLTKGIHTVQIRLRAKGPLAFNVNFRLIFEKHSIVILTPPFLPDLVDGKLFSKLLPVPISNLHASKWLKLTQVSLTNGDTRKQFSVKIYDEGRNFPIAPGQTRTMVLQIDAKNEKTTQKSSTSKCSDVNFPLKLSFDNGDEDKLDLKLRCRKLQESFLFSFVDHDGSVQHAAAVAPLEPCESGTCPVLLTLHGTTVPPQNQADSYKRMVNGKWIFGVEHLWVLAPTLHGAHNWEGPGELTAMTALSSLSALTKKTPWLKNKASDQQIVIAGHSMGGHGAWQLGTHYPDNALALISAAGWIKKEDYGDSNLFFRHDISASHVDPVVKSLMEACVAENDADKHVSNLHGLPVMIRTGAKDQTVHPYYSRRMYRLLRQQRSNVTYSEIPGKEHWWWDTYTTNDGGVTNDPVIRDFAIRHAKDAAACDSSTGKGDRCSDERSAADKYKEHGNSVESERNLAGDGTFMLTTYNPASSTGVRGVRVLQQLVPFRLSTVEITLSSGTAVLRATNVARISLGEPAVSPVHWLQRSLEIDEVRIGLPEMSSQKPLELCKTDGTNWVVCETFDLHKGTERGPLNMGPARRVAERPFLIVTGTRGGVVGTRVLRQFSVYIANHFHLTSEAIAPIVTDTELDGETAAQHNLIIVGSPADNTWAEQFHAGIPLKYQNSTLSMGNCVYKAQRTGALFLAPHAGTRLALVLSGNSQQGLRDVIHLATPTIPPMARSPFSNLIPDYVITGPRFGARGPGGYLCTGFWGNRWEYRRDLASCAC